MAENKKSFVLYADFIDTFEMLSDEEAGQLIKHIFQYVNDQNPTLENKLLNIAFNPIKQQLKRDLLKWSDMKNKRSEAGKASAEARKNKKQQTSTKSTSVKSVKNNSTKSTVTVNDNVNVTVNDNVIVNDNDIIYPFNSENFVKFWGVWKQYKKDEHKFKYKSAVTEQAALKKLAKLSNNDELNAIELIENAIAQGWKGFYLDNNKNNLNNGNNSGIGETTANRIKQTFG